MIRAKSSQKRQKNDTTNLKINYKMITDNRPVTESKNVKPNILLENLLSVRAKVKQIKFDGKKYRKIKRYILCNIQR